MIPPQSPWQEWVNPVLPARLCNYPIVTKDQQYGLFGEVETDWVQGANVRPEAHELQYTGNVWSIQLTARPGYYVTPENLERYGLNGGGYPNG